ATGPGSWPRRRRTRTPACRVSFDARRRGPASPARRPGPPVGRRRLSFPPSGQPEQWGGTVEDDARLEAGRELARRYFGEGVTERWREISPALEEITSRFAFGDVWSRPALGIRERALIALACTAALRAHAQLGWHARGALRSGLTADEIRE